MADNPNGKFTKVEQEMALDEIRNALPMFMAKTVSDAQYLKAKYDNLKAQGFTSDEALEIVKSRPLYE